MAAPVLPLLPPAPLVALLLKVGLALASPVVPEIPLTTEVAPLLLPLVALPSALAVASPLCARNPSPDSALTLPGTDFMAAPDPAFAIGLAIELPDSAEMSPSIEECESPESPPSPDPPLRAVGFDVMLPE